jgi:MoaA/NifB/PqqE/SkfB family radical SAM enzyme
VRRVVQTFPKEVKMLPDHINDAFYDVFPGTLTIITTYKCNAACAECCFECRPTLTARLSRQEIIERIDQAFEAYPALRMVVFTGGECFLLGDDLYAAIGHAASLGLMTRCVTNGFWGKSAQSAKRVVRRLVDSKISEINISTGLEHQQWVSQAAVVNAARALLENGVPTLVTVEKDTEESACFKEIHTQLVEEQFFTKFSNLFRLQSNSWMPFHADAVTRVMDKPSELRKGCSQVFRNVVVTPYDKLSACCGLTLEHIPEMSLGDLKQSDMKELYESQLDDFLKIWIYVDGPYEIINKLLSNESDRYLSSIVHHCQACVVLHKNEVVKEVLMRRFWEFVPDVLARFNVAVAAEARTSVLRSKTHSQKERVV